MIVETLEFTWPWVFVALPTPWLVRRLVPPHRERIPGLRVPFFRSVAAAAGAQPRAGSVILARRRIETAVGVLVWTLLLTALARPQRVGEPVEITKAARDVVLAIDVSGSMDQNDMPAEDGSRRQRLAVVKRVVGEFIEARDGDRVALLVFGTKAFIQSPFTEDLATVRALLEQSEVGMAGPHTVIGDAIGLGIRTFEASEVEERLMILLSDGADTGSRMSPVNAAEIASRDSVEIFTIGVGDPNASADQQVDLDVLQEIASRTGGEFFFADDERALSTVYDRIATMSPRKVETLSFRPRESLGHWLLGLAGLVTLVTVGALHIQATLRGRSVK